MTLQQLTELREQIRAERLKRAARLKLLDFSAYTFKKMVANFHHRLLCANLQWWIDTPGARLIAVMPRRHGKTEFCSLRLPAFIFGRNPDAKVLACSNIATMASSTNRKLQRIMTSDEYQELFPGTRLFGKNIRTVAGGGTWLRNSDEFQIVGADGIYCSAGVGGAIRGKGGDFLIADDLYKGRKEANSPTHRKHVWEWFKDDFLPCAEGDEARVLIIMTRYRQDDVIGAAIDEQKKNPKLTPWRVVRFPALMEPEDDLDRTPGDDREIGEALWESKVSRESWEAQRDSSSALHWSGSAQGRPVPAQGSIYLQDHFRDWRDEQKEDGHWWAVLPDPINEEIVAKWRFDQCRWFQCIDTALTTDAESAFTAVVTFGLTPAFDLLIYHVWRWRLLVPDIYPALMALRHGPRSGKPPQLKEWKGEPWPFTLLYQAIETKASGVMVFQLGAARGTPFVELKADADKVQRSVQAATMYRSGKVWHRENGPLMGVLQDELLVFPSGQFKDIADCVAYGGRQATIDELLRAGFGGDVVIYPTAEDIARMTAGKTIQVGEHTVPIEDEDNPWWRQ